MPITGLQAVRVLSWPRRTLDALLPRTVAAADEIDVTTGDAVWQPGDADEYCQRCGASCGPGAALASGCSACVGIRPAIRWDRLVRLGAYHEPLSGWIVDMKFHRNWNWAVWFGQRLADQIDELNVNISAFDDKPSPRLATAMPSAAKIGVCPVPLHWLRRWQRGFNQAHYIATPISQRLGWPILPVLRRHRYTAPQTRVTPSARPKNVSDAFSIADIDLNGWEIWLVDDVKTSGSTLSACVKLLRGAGARRVHVAVVAVTEHPA